MTCIKCGGNLSADMLFCPYCGCENQSGLEHAQKIYDVDKDFMETHEEILETGVSTAIKQLTQKMILIFIVFLLLSGALYAGFKYRYGEQSRYWVTGSRLTENKKLIGEYLENGDYLRAYTLASFTDPTQEYFSYYPEYKDDLYAIFCYYNIFSRVNLNAENIDDDESFRSLDTAEVLCVQLFYNLPDTEIKMELEKEVDAYLINMYQLTEDEVSQLKATPSTEDFTLEGSTDIAEITKERMRKAFYEK